MASTSNSSTSPHYVYTPNAVLRATFTDDSDAVIGMIGAPKSLKEAEFKVVRTLATTLSCVLIVEPVGTHQHRFPRRLILKVYDERFADNIREDNRVLPWTPAQRILLDEFKALPNHLKPQIIDREYDQDSEWWNGDPSSSSDDTVSAVVIPYPSKYTPTGIYDSSTADAQVPTAKQGHAARTQQTPEPEADDWENIQAVPDDDMPSDSDSESDSGSDANVDYDDDDAVDVDDDNADYNDADEPEDISVEEVDKALRERLRPGFLEAVGELTCGRLYSDEMAVYRHLRDLQGKSIPGCYGSVVIQPALPMVICPGGIRSLCPGPGPTTSNGEHHDGPKALILQFIDNSFTLRDVPEKITDTSVWQDIGKAAVKLVQEIGDCGVLNSDVRLDNFLIVPIVSSKRAKRTASKRNKSPEKEGVSPRNNQKYKVVMIDFGLARVWNEDEETEEEFRRARLGQDEEGAVGCVFESHLCKALKVKPGTEESPFRYRPSDRLRRSWDHDDDC